MNVASSAPIGSRSRPPSHPSVPDFSPVCPRGGRFRLRRFVRRRRRGLAVALAAAALALALAVPGGGSAGEPGPGRTERVETAVAAGAREGPGTAEAAAGSGETVSAPVRIADAAAVRLLRPGDRVDVLAAAAPPGGEAAGPARVVARRARVAEVPGTSGASEVSGAVGPEDGGGALLVLTVSPATAAELAGAAAVADLAVVRW
ncbi:RcpC/CpaB family pilus assembly protein [Streptomyces sp. NBC_01803]|uniref:RcpC/CpaB family pilus assembly protein n=1 Tax=Streptomyces sp. NBC_01803 TaxID=2975946 RepID=UPI002DD95D72|nr:RcpC/CpaB family pilus assembly protein [Streptomyces sp. NBC_01803]WSA44683.1 RcpC/CpaB family pilus assembly protein [Streptomyces sp. NBC_01803]